LIPAFPIRPDRQEVYPRALGQAFVGKSFLDLPEVKAKVPEAQGLRKEVAPQPEPSPALAKPAEARFQPLEPLGLTNQGPAISRPAAGSLFDLNA